MRPDRGEGRLAALPDDRALGVVVGDADLGGAVAPADLLDDLHVLGDLLRDPVELGDQDRAGALGVARMHRGLGGLDRQAVHHLDRRGQDARGDDVGDGAARLIGRRGRTPGTS